MRWNMWFPLVEKSPAFQFRYGPGDVRALSVQLPGQNPATQLPATVGAFAVDVMCAGATVQGIPRVVAREAWCQSLDWNICSEKEKSEPSAPVLAA